MSKSGACLAPELRVDDDALTVVEDDFVAAEDAGADYELVSEGCDFYWDGFQIAQLDITIKYRSYAYPSIGKDISPPAVRLHTFQQMAWNATSPSNPVSSNASSVYP